MVIGEAIGSTDVAIIGGGPGGYTAAIKCAQEGKKVTVVDRESVGGICLHHGCIPTKALIHAADMVQESKKAAEYGVSFSGISVDFKKTQEWKRNIIKKLDNGVRGLFKHYGITLLKAEAFFEESNKLSLHPLDENEHLEINALEFKKCIIATGSRERMIPGIEVDGESILTSTHAIELETLPESVLVIGGGYIGIELSQMMAKLGVKVTIVEALPRILNLLDEEFSSIVQKNVEAFGGTVFASAKVEKVEKKDGKVSTTFNKDGKSQTVVTDKVIVAIGRVPNAEQLHLDTTKVQLDEHGFIKIDKKMQTTDPRIFAIGDVAGGAMLAHKAAFEAKIAAEVIAGKSSAFDNLVPFAIFSDPEIAGVGLNETQAKEQGLSYKVKKFNSSTSGKSQIMGDKGSFFKVIYEENGTIHGLHICGARASDMIGEAVLAMEMGATIEDLSLIIHPHPTLVEGYGELADLALGKPTNSL
ncbi:dihydrolipoyl dehydrogenase [Candidatus Woesearchaeota archaeon]|nr:dihydrolipoyl dehydrogenase [Candidatus Woesearchaeota archaeon]